MNVSKRKLIEWLLDNDDSFSLYKEDKDVTPQEEEQLENHGAFWRKDSENKEYECQLIWQSETECAYGHVVDNIYDADFLISDVTCSEKAIRTRDILDVIFRDRANYWKDSYAQTHGWYIHEGD